MTWTHNFTWFYKFILIIGLPFVNIYHHICEDHFLNVSAEDAVGFEYIGNQLLKPYQYLFVGRKAVATGDEKVPYNFYQTFRYETHWKSKTMVSIVLLPQSFFWGTVFKSLAFFSADTRKRYSNMQRSKVSCCVKNNNELYHKIGMCINEKIKVGESAPTSLCQRRDGDENHLKNDKQTLQDVVAILEKENIPYWVDCGTCLGAYRYQGVIPWDNDIDIAILQPDSDNVKRALNTLDPDKYEVWDWSSRDKPSSFLKVYAKGTDVLLDIYHYKVDFEEKTLTYIVSNENNIFLSEEWKSRERKYTAPVSFEMIFPLKRALFDGIEVAVPNKMVEYLQVRYGENLSPLMKYNPESSSYEKDEEHPYWKILES